jgi:hypothetical protein
MESLSTHIEDLDFIRIFIVDTALFHLVPDQ